MRDARVPVCLVALFLAGLATDLAAQAWVQATDDYYFKISTSYFRSHEHYDFMGNLEPIAAQDLFYVGLAQSSFLHRLDHVEKLAVVVEPNHVALARAQVALDVFSVATGGGGWPVAYQVAVGIGAVAHVGADTDVIDADLVDCVIQCVEEVIQGRTGGHLGAEI